MAKKYLKVKDTIVGNISASDILEGSLSDAKNIIDIYLNDYGGKYDRLEFLDNFCMDATYFDLVGVRDETDKERNDRLKKASMEKDKRKELKKKRLIKLEKEIKKLKKQIK